MVEWSTPPLPRGRVTFVDAPGRPSVDVEVARTHADQERGLMHRRSLAPDAGMLFSWPADEVRTMWMRNVLLPFDMVFIKRDGLVADVLSDVPTLNDVLRSSPRPVAHVLELNAGWTRARGIRVGQRASIEAA